MFVKDIFRAHSSAQIKTAVAQKTMCREKKGKEKTSTNNSKIIFNQIHKSISLIGSNGD